MNPRRPPAQHALSLACGVAMVAATEPQTHRLALWIAAAAVAAVLAGVRIRSAATVAVVLTALALLAAGTPSLLAVVSGLCATGYLVTRPGTGPAYATPTKATLAAALAFGIVGAAVALIPVNLAWLPLAAPFGLMAAYALAVRPFRHRPEIS